MSWLLTLTTLGGLFEGKRWSEKSLFAFPTVLVLTRGVPVAPQKDDQPLAPGGGAPLSQGEVVAT